MSPLAVLLRVLLCIALVLNGSVPMAHAAMAKTPVMATHDEAAQDAATSDPEGHGGCHDGAMTHDAPPADAPSGSDHDDDCCTGDGDCRSRCAQHCAVSIPGVAVLDLTLPPAAGPLPMAALAHPDPSLRDRIRPPIA